MKTIEISDDRFEKIRRQALSAGYQDIGAYLEALAEDAAFDARSGMSDAELRQSAEECDAIAQRMEQGAEKDAKEALLELGHKLRLNRPS